MTELTDDEIVALGLCDDDKRHTGRLEFVRMLFDRGATLEEVRAAAAQGQHYLNALAVEMLFVPRGSIPLADAAAATGASPEQIVEWWRALGLSDPSQDGVLLNDGEIGMIELVNEFVALAGAGVMSDTMRTVGWRVAQIGEACVTAARMGVERPARMAGASELDVIEIQAYFGREVVPRLISMFETLFRRALVNSAYGDVVVTEAGDLSSNRTIVFADLVNYTGFARQATSTELATRLSRFEAAAIAHTQGHRGQLVKLLGDGVMLQFRQRNDAIAAARAIVGDATDAFSCRAGVATGPVIMRNADFFGPVVNLAARLGGAVDAGEVAIDDVEPVTGAVLTNPIELKGIDEPVAFYRLS